MIGKRPDIRIAGPCSRGLSGLLNRISVLKVREDLLIVLFDENAHKLVINEGDEDLVTTDI